jgi:hypothetical protein
MLRGVQADARDSSVVGILVVLLATGGLLAWVLLGDEPENGHGMAHPRVEAMRAGGDASVRADDALWAGAALGCLLIVLFALCLRLGAQRGDGRSGVGRWLLAGTAAWLGVFLAVVLGYRAFAGGDTDRIVMGFPAATAWMIYGLWSVPAVFTVLYMVGFERFVSSRDAERAFEALLVEQRGAAAALEPNAAVVETPPGRGA